MALIQMSDAQAVLYRAWLAYYGVSTPQSRTAAYFNSKEGHPVPITC